MSLLTLISGSSEIISGTVLLITAFFILKKDPKYDLNRLVALAVSSFSLTIISEGLLYILQSTDAMLINLLRDITELSGIMAGTCILLAGVEVNRGKYWRNYRVVIPVLILGILGIFGVVFHDALFLSIGESIYYYSEGRFFWAVLFASGIPIIERLVGVFLFNVVRRDVDDEKLKKKLLYLQAGMIGVMLSAAFIVIVLTVLVPAGIALDLFPVIIGQIGYLISCVLVFTAFK